MSVVSSEVCVDFVSDRSIISSCWAAAACGVCYNLCHRSVAFNTNQDVFVILTDKIHNHFLNSDSSTLFVILQSYYRLSRHIDRTKINSPGVSILLGWCNNTSLNNMLITGWATSKINVTLTSKQWSSTLLWSNRLMYCTSQIRTAMTSTVSHKHRQTCAHYSPTPLVQLTAQLHNTYRDYSS